MKLCLTCDPQMANLWILGILLKAGWFIISLCVCKKYRKDNGHITLKKSLGISTVYYVSWIFYIFFNIQKILIIAQRKTWKKGKHSAKFNLKYVSKV